MSFADFIPIINEHIKKYDGFSARDAYKLLYQCHMGPGHLITDIDSTKKYLHTELKKTKPDNSISLEEKISPDNKIVRINLAPFKSRGLDIDKLLDVFVNSANTCDRDIDSFIKDWNDLVKMSLNAEINLSPENMLELDKIVLEHGYPPVHHSDEYSQKNKPAYRVVLRDIFLKSFPAL